MFLSMETVNKIQPHDSWRFENSQRPKTYSLRQYWRIFHVLRDQLQPRKSPQLYMQVKESIYILGQLQMMAIQVCRVLSLMYGLKLMHNDQVLASEGTFHENVWPRTVTTIWMLTDSEATWDIKWQVLAPHSENFCSLSETPGCDSDLHTALSRMMMMRACDDTLRRGLQVLNVARYDSSKAW